MVILSIVEDFLPRKNFDSQADILMSVGVYDNQMALTQIEKNPNIPKQC